MTQEPLSGLVADIRYHNPTTERVSLIVAAPDGTSHRAVGLFARPIVGEQVTLRGRFSPHALAGRVFEFESVSVSLPEGPDAQIDYLSRITGMERSICRALYDRFGDETPVLLEHEPTRLLEVPGMREEMVRQANERLRAHLARQADETLVREYGLSDVVLSRLRNRAGGDHPLTELMRTDPFGVLLLEPSLSWSHIESLARRRKLPPDHPSRIQAALLQVLLRHAGRGHTVIDLPDLFEQTNQRLGLRLPPDDRRLVGAIRSLDADHRLVLTEESAALPDLHHAELGVADYLRHITLGERELETAISPDRLARVAEKQGASSHPAVLEAVGLALSRKVLLVDAPEGEPMRQPFVALLRHVIQQLGGTVHLAAPGYFGRAHKPAGVLPDALIGRFGLGTPNYHPGRPLETDLLILDRADRLDAPTLAACLAALPASAGVVLIGDTHQVAPDGPGQPFRDLALSKQFPMAALTQERTTDALGAFVRGLRGDGALTLDADPNPHHPLSVLPMRLDVEKAARTVIQLAQALFPSLGVRGPLDVAVVGLCAPTVLSALNAQVQAALNPAGEPIPGRADLRVGDWVYFQAPNTEPWVPVGASARISALTNAPHLVLETAQGPVTLPAQAVSRLAPGYVRPAAPDPGRPVKLLIALAFPETLSRLHSGVLYRLATNCRRLVLIGPHEGWLAAAARPAPVRFSALPKLLEVR